MSKLQWYLQVSEGQDGADQTATVPRIIANLLRLRPELTDKPAIELERGGEEGEVRPHVAPHILRVVEEVSPAGDAHNEAT